MNLLNKNHPKYEPDKWNNDFYIKKSHNCYSYAFNIIDKKRALECKKKLENNLKYCERPQPGLYSGYLDNKRKVKFTESSLIRRMKEDNPLIKKISKDSNIKDGYYKICLFLNEKEDKHHNNYNDYHFYRQDNSGEWSHKDGWRKATNKDVKNKIINDPEYAQKRYVNKKYNYKLVGYFMIPNERKYKNISHK